MIISDEEFIRARKNLDQLMSLEGKAYQEVRAAVEKPKAERNPMEEELSHVVCKISGYLHVEVDRIKQKYSAVQN
jgi:hypothetical protein